METLAPGNEQPQQPEEPQSVLDGVFDTSAYNAQVKKAQNAIFMVAAIQLVLGIVMAFTAPENKRIIQFAVAAVVSALFFCIGFWSKYKPFAAIITALCLYCSLVLLNAGLEPHTFIDTLFKGIVVKIFVTAALIRGISAAKAARDIKNIGK